MPNFNKVFLMGHLTKDVELRCTQSGITVALFGLAVNRIWNCNGEKKQEVGFFDCTVFGKSGETLAQYVKKGSPLFVEGRLQYRQWEAPDGKKQSKVSIVVERYQFIGAGKEKKERNGDYPSEEACPDIKEENIPF